MMHPLRHFVSAPDGTNDALILADIEDKIGSHAENLTSEDKLAFLAVLSRYLYFLQWVEPDYSIGAALTDTMLLIDTTQDSDDESANTPPETEEIWDILLTLEGISTEGATQLLQFITQQQDQGIGMSQELSLSVTAALDAFYQVKCLQELLFISLDEKGQSLEKRKQRTELLTICYLHQVKPYLEELEQELKEIRQGVNRAYTEQIRAMHGAGLAAEKVKLMTKGL